MNVAQARNFDTDPVSPELRADYAANRLTVLWESPNGALPPPSEKALAWHWKDIRPVMLETAKITLPAIMERRVMQCANPTVGNPDSEAISGLLNAGFQALMPGEHARPHRHSMHALRFVLEGEGAETIVENKPCRMEPGDLVVTPGWTWHEHRNPEGRPTIWVDILDAALHRALGTAAFQPGPMVDPRPAIADSAFVSGAFVPVTPPSEVLPYTPVFRYAWADARRAVQAAPAADDGSRSVRYANPVNGAPVLPTIDCTLLQVEAGLPTRACRSSASGLCIVVEGEGETRIGDDVIRWQPNDVISLPQHRWISHHATRGPARIFVASNREIYRHLGLLTEERAA